MKLAVLLFAVLACFSVGPFLRRRQDVLVVIAFLVAFLPFVGLDRFDLNLLSHQRYRGESRGFEVTIVDLFAIILWRATPPCPAPYPIPRIVYVLATAASVIGAPLPLFSLFSVWKAVRMYFFLGTMARAARVPALASALLCGLGCGVVYSLGIALSQRYVFGFMRAKAAFSHPNSLAMAVNLVMPMAFATALAIPRSRLASAAAVAAPLCVVLTLSRGAMALSGLGLATVLCISLLRGVTKLKLRIALSALALACVAALKSFDTIVSRFTSAPAASEGARVLFNQAAKAMLEEHPRGIGINQYSYVLSNLGYAERVGLPEIDRDGIAHHVYWLTAAETGWVGIASYAVVLAYPLVLAVRGFLRDNGPRGDLLLGCSVGLATMYLQGTAEWVARQTGMSYLFSIVAGLVVGLGAGVARGRSSVST